MEKPQVHIKLIVNSLQFRHDKEFKEFKGKKKEVEKVEVTPIASFENEDLYGISGSMIPSKPLGEDPSLSLPAFDDPRHSLVCSSINSNLGFCLHMVVFSLCVGVSLGPL